MHRQNLLAVALSAALFVAGALSSCNALPPTGLKHRDSNLVKPAAEIVVLERQAAEGDGQASWDLFVHYAFGLRDEAKAEPWLQKAAQSGNSRAKHYIEIRNRR